MIGAAPDSFPDVEVFGVARCGDFSAALASSAIQSRSDILLAVWQLREWNFKGTVRFEQIQVVKDLGDNFFVLAVAAFWDVRLIDRFVSH